MITLPIEIGDTVLMGKFKNRKVVVKKFGEDEYGHPTINGKKILTIRIAKLMNKKTKISIIADQIMKKGFYEKS